MSAGEAPRTEVPRCGYVCGLSERVHEDARTGHAFYEAAAAPPEPLDQRRLDAFGQCPDPSAHPAPPGPCDHSEGRSCPECIGPPGPPSGESDARGFVTVECPVCRFHHAHRASSGESDSPTPGIVSVRAVDEWGESDSPGIDPRTGRPPWDTEV